MIWSFPKLLAAWIVCFFVWSTSANSADIETLAIETRAGEKLIFFVEVAKTDREREVGLMNRKTLAANAGMLFDFATPRPVSMWMRNTLIPLDMIFIKEDGSISSIAENTVPHSLDIIRSPEPVTAVLEINGGMSKQLRIKAGDHVQHPLFE